MNNMIVLFPKTTPERNVEIILIKSVKTYKMDNEFYLKRRKKRRNKLKYDIR